MIAHTKGKNSMDAATLANKVVMLKLRGHDRSAKVTVESLDATGLWFQHAGLAKALFGTDIMPIEVGHNPHVFVPLCQIEFLLVSDTALQ